MNPEVPRGRNRDFLVTGTDTGVGKTLVAAALVRWFAGQGFRAIGMKPVAAGCELRAGILGNDDVAALLAASNVAVDEQDVNPYRFAPPIAPHIAAAQAGVRISIETIAAAYASLCRKADAVIVEGAGGWLVPLNEQDDFSDLAGTLDLPVLLVVGMRLGCLNHAFLTAEMIQQKRLRLAGWVANRLDPQMVEFDANLEALRERLSAPLLGIVPFGPPPPSDVADLLGVHFGKS
jgi:dethiobiotin synthetase